MFLELKDDKHAYWTKVYTDVSHDTLTCKTWVGVYIRNNSDFNLRLEDNTSKFTTEMTAVFIGSPRQ